MKKILLIIFLFTIYNSYINAQELSKNIRPESPAIAEFMRYDDMPVSEYTGIPDISIPIFNIVEDDFELPIKLTYHAGGIKVNQQASWVGLGWDLRLGSLMQIINDEDDFGTNVSGASVERMLPNYPGSPTGIGCVSSFPMRYDFPLGTPGTGWTATYPTNKVQIRHDFKRVVDFYVPVNGDFTTRRVNFFSNNYQPNIDSEPDIFKVNLMNENIHFIIDWKTKKYVVLNKQGYKITKVENDWIITNPMGEQFFFGDKIATTLITTLGTEQKKTSFMWFLKKIITRNGKQITIEYDFTDSVEMPESKTMIYKNFEYTSTLALTGIHPLSGYGSSNFNKHTAVNISKTKEPYYFIQKITFPKGNIIFTTSSRLDIAASKKLEQITISNNEETIKQIDLNYDYFNETGGGKRLKLKSITENDESIYSFNYNESNLPPINSYSQDCWGYYNGHSNSSLIPNPSRYYLIRWDPDATDNGNNMSSNFSYTKIGTLNSIFYPTGGKVLFEFESNEFDNYGQRVPDYHESSSSSNVGITKGHGLRIKKITHYENGNIAKETTYTYEGGKAILPKIFFRTMPHAYFIGTSINSYLDSGSLHESTVSGYTIFNPLSSLDGVGYNKVTKRIIDTAVNENSRIETIYNNNPDITFLYCNPREAISPIPAYKDHIYPTNGTILKRKYYDSENNLIKKDSCVYYNVLSSIYYGARTSALDKYYTWYSRLMIYDRSLIGYYPIFDFQTLQKENHETLYFNGTPVTKTYKHTYDSSNRLTNTKENISGTSGTINTYYTYPFSSDNVGAAMITNNRTAELITKYSISNQGRSSSYLKNNYILNNGKIQLGSIEKRNSSSSSIINKLDYELYDTNNNPLQIRAKDEVPITYIWGYNRNYPVAEIKNATYETVKSKLTPAVLTSIETEENLSDSNINKLNGLRESLPSALVSVFTHKPLIGITSITDERGNKVSFEYDNLGRMAYTKDIDDNILSKNTYHFQNVRDEIFDSVVPEIIKMTRSGSLVTVEYYVRDPDPSQVFELIARNTTKNQTITSSGDYSNGKKTVMTFPGFTFITLKTYYKGKLIEVSAGNISY